MSPVDQSTPSSSEDTPISKMLEGTTAESSLTTPTHQISPTLEAGTTTAHLTPASPSNDSPSLESVQDLPINDYVDLINTQLTYQPLPHSTKWTKAHPSTRL
ncbi:hypothetical protein L6452_15171 [Arctium lappa]|uniref:Uncharacterized protein n=1 Tax=Arctium lappa TaxID=4217 RepID=A0ACB9CNA5_ARCLA|nr:hypothetical protein L6452_15171 [Arctium lappa]